MRARGVLFAAHVAMDQILVISFWSRHRFAVPMARSGRSDGGDSEIKIISFW